MNRFFLTATTLQYAALMIQRRFGRIHTNVFTWLSVCLFMVCFFSCKSNQQEKQDKFDKAKWAVKEEKDYPYRDKMLNDLVTNHLLHGLKKSQVQDMLGQPNRTDSLYLFYTIAQERLGVFPLHTKTLVIKLTSDSSLEWRKIHQ